MSDEQITDSIAVLTHYSTTLNDMSKTVAGLLQQLKSRAQLKIEESGFYQTLDHSTVMVVRQYDHDDCDCPSCQQKKRNNNLKIAHMFKYETSDEEEVHYLCIILRGGHGIDGVNGKEPGDSYLINNEGLVFLIGDIKSQPEVSAHILGMIGLSLMKKIDYTVKTEKKPKCVKS